jgi:hypothetical protein
VAISAKLTPSAARSMWNSVSLNELSAQSSLISQPMVPSSARQLRSEGGSGGRNVGVALGVGVSLAVRVTVALADAEGVGVAVGVGGGVEVGV